MKRRRLKNFVPARPIAELSTGEVIRMLRELKEWIQDQLAEQLAKAFSIHPAVIMFPEYESEAIQKAA